ncbi:MAG: molybdopterin molybdotransferase MoeA [Chloroflexi bacterium]|nr:molybdopterin molybdotransferase MoeA [Chloroflexota bacterium]
MLSVEEALERILSFVAVLDIKEQPLLTCLGQVLGVDLRAPFAVPPLDNAAMDGYALRAEDIAGASLASPRRLRVIGQVAAGALAREPVRPGTAVRIMTGAPLPEGADTVVPFEETDEVERRHRNLSLAEIAVTVDIKAGANIRRAGEDISAGSLVLERGTVLRPAELGVLASLGRATLPVVRRPVVAVLATGDELVEVGQPLPEGKIYNSNTYSLMAQVQRYGGIPRGLGVARDNLASLREKLAQGLEADLLITSAGVSVGDYDVVKDALAQMGEVSFWSVRMKPGKPLAFGLLGQGPRRVPHLGLPGNPVSSMITFEQFARPAILKMMGRQDLAKPTVQAVLEEDIQDRSGRRHFVRAWVTRRDGRYYARTTGPQGSGILTSMARANGLVVIPEEQAEVKAGSLVPVQMLDWD